MQEVWLSEYKNIWLHSSSFTKLHLPKQTRPNKPPVNSRGMLQMYIEHLLGNWFREEKFYFKVIDSVYRRITVF